MVSQLFPHRYDPTMGSTRGKVVVAMSGGVDSSVAAGLLVREGYEVIGVFMRLGSPGDILEEACDITNQAKIGKQGCCSVRDAHDARHVAAELSIPLYICNFADGFSRVIDYFVDEYASGRTPNPCVRCNDWLKFGRLHDQARQLGADVVASGHYARLDSYNGYTTLARGRDSGKDQSYVLFGVEQNRINEMMLPIGQFEKSRVREMAREMGLPVFDKPDSQEICFVPDDDYAGFVERRRPELTVEGRIIDTSGEQVGTHDGHHHFTIGQRRGLKVAMGHPIYVVERDPLENTVTVGLREDLESTRCTAGETNWLIPLDAPGEWTPCLAQYRYASDAVEARVRVIENATQKTSSGRPGRFEIRFDEPQTAIAPGQAIVLYAPDQPEAVLGGGWIERALR